MIRLLCVVALLLLAVMVTPILVGNKGYVLIQTQDYSIHMSLITLLIVWIGSFLVVMFLAYIIKKVQQIISVPYYFFFKRKVKRADQQTLKGLMQLTEGNYKQARALIADHAHYSTQPVLSFIKAALVAQKQGNTHSADRYLKDAEGLAKGRHSIALRLARTKIALMQGDLSIAKDQLDHLITFDRRNPEVLRHAIIVYQKLAAYHALDELLEEIDYQNLLHKDDFIALSNWVSEGIIIDIAHTKGVAELLAWWESQGKSRKNVNNQLVMLDQLIRAKAHEDAYEFAIMMIKKYDDEQLDKVLALLVSLDIKPKSPLMNLLIKRMKKADAISQGAFARVIAFSLARNHQYEQAIAYFQCIEDHHQLSAHDREMYYHIAKELNDFARIKRLEQLYKQNNFNQ